MYKHLKIFVVIFLCSAASLAYEITLTRIFSISLWYHFAFMIISIAMLGIAASGTVLSINPKLKNLDYIGSYSLLLGIGIFMSYILSNQIPFDPAELTWSKAQLLYIGIYYLILCIPFFFTGMTIATALSSLSDKSGLLYGADLLGAGIGSLGILFLLTLAGPDRAVFIVSSLALSSSYIAGGKGIKIISILLISLALALFLLNPSLLNLRMSPYKGLEVALRYPGAQHLKTYYSPYSRIDVFKSPAVRFAPGMSLRYLEKLPEQIGFSIDGGEINAITSYGQRQAFTFLTYLPSALAYEMGKTNNVLILDPKGGLQVLVAGYYGSPNIYKIEGNPLLVKVIDKDFKEFSGGIYSWNTWSGLGRSWLKNNVKKFDSIDIQMMGAAPSGSFGISEDYRFTVEAFKEYLNHLTPEGVISINLFILPPPRIELRILNTAVSAMDDLGIENSNRHIAAIRSWGSICILVKKSPFGISEIEVIKKFSRDRRFDLIYYPGITEEETNIYIRMPSNEYFKTFGDILNPLTRGQFITNYLFDISPVHDENPFFHYYLKAGNIKDTYKIMGEKWQYFIEEGYILPAVFIQVLSLSLILILLPAFSRKNKNPLLPPFGRGGMAGFDAGFLFLPYFLFLGLGYMFVEISLIQKIILPLENTFFAVATVITSLLISSGAGSLLSYKISGLRSPFILMAITLLILVYSLVLPVISDIIVTYQIAVKIFLTFIFIMPLGLFMGIPFPTGLKILSERNESMIPWAWAINGCFSVLAPVLAVMLSIVIGFKMVLWLGALTYFMAFLNLKRFLRDNRLP